MSEGIGPDATFYDVESNDPESELVERSALTADDVSQINRLMNALGELRAAENELSEASRRYMRLNETDMRALHFLIVASNRAVPATPGAIAQHLKISTASTTKLLDRLERAGHVTRRPHPHDRRALVIEITPETRAAAIETVGRQHARRFLAAAKLSSEERETVTAFLRDMAAELGRRDSGWGRPDDD